MSAAAGTRPDEGNEGERETLNDHGGRGCGTQAIERISRGAVICSRFGEAGHAGVDEGSGEPVRNRAVLGGRI
jgi:hypothetical protein